MRGKQNFSRVIVLCGVRIGVKTFVGWEQRQGNFWVEDTHTPKFELERGFQVRGAAYFDF